MAVWSLVATQPNGSPVAGLDGASSRKVTARLTEPSTIEWTLPGSDPAAPQIVELATDVIAYRDQVPVMRCRVGPTTDDLSGDSYQVSYQASDYRAVLARRTIWPTSRLVFTAKDQSIIAWSLIADSQALPDGGLGLTLSSLPATGQLRDRTYEAGKSIGEAINEMAALGTGFNWDVSPDLKVQIWGGARGALKDFVCAYGSSVVAFNRSLDPGDYANAVRVSGADGVPAVVASATDLSTRREGRWERQVGFTDIKSSAVLAEQAAGQLSDSSTIRPAYSVTLAPGAWLGPSTVWIGDEVRLVIKRGRLNVNEIVRVYEVSVTLGDNGEEAVSLTLGRPKPSVLRTIASSTRRLRNLERSSGAGLLEADPLLASASNVAAPTVAAVRSYVAAAGSAVGPPGPPGPPSGMVIGSGLSVVPAPDPDLLDSYAGVLSASTTAGSTVVTAVNSALYPFLESWNGALIKNYSGGTLPADARFVWTGSVSVGAFSSESGASATTGSGVSTIGRWSSFPAGGFSPIDGFSDQYRLRSPSMFVGHGSSLPYTQVIVALVSGVVPGTIAVTTLDGTSTLTPTGGTSLWRTSGRGIVSTSTGNSSFVYTGKTATELTGVQYTKELQYAGNIISTSVCYLDGDEVDSLGLRIRVDHKWDSNPNWQQSSIVPGPAGLIQVDGTIEVGPNAPSLDNFGGTLVNSSRQFVNKSGFDAYPGGYLNGVLPSDVFLANTGKHHIYTVSTHVVNTLLLAQVGGDVHVGRVTDLAPMNDFVQSQSLTGTAKVGLWQGVWAAAPSTEQASSLYPAAVVDKAVGVDVGGYGWTAGGGLRVAFASPSQVQALEARTHNGVVVTSGSTTITSPVAVFVAGDAGKNITGVGIPNAATILTFTSSTVVILSAAANATSATGTPVTIYGSPIKAFSLDDIGMGLGLVEDQIQRTIALVARSGSTLTLANSFTAADVGREVSGDGIPAGSIIVSQTGGTATLSNAISPTTTAAVNIHQRRPWRGVLGKLRWKTFITGLVSADANGCSDTVTISAPTTLTGGSWWQLFSKEMSVGLPYRSSRAPALGVRTADPISIRPTGNRNLQATAAGVGDGALWLDIPGELASNAITPVDPSTALIGADGQYRITGTANTVLAPPFLQYSPQIRYARNGGGFGSSTTFWDKSVHETDPAATAITSLGLSYSFLGQTVHRANGHTGVSVSQIGMVSEVTMATSNGGTITSGSITSFRSDLIVGAGVSGQTRYGFRVVDADGAGTLLTQYGIHVAAMTKAATNFAASLAGTTIDGAGNYIGAGYVQATTVRALGITGAAQAARWVGATTTGAPTSGTFVVGDWIIAQDAKQWVCTVAGTPGTWVSVGGSASAFLIDGSINTIPTGISGVNYLYATDAAPILVLGYNRTAGAIVAGGNLSSIQFWGYDGAAMRTGGILDFSGDDTAAWASGLAGAKFSITTTKLGGTTGYRRLILDNAGDLFIGSPASTTVTTKTNATFVARQDGRIQSGVYATPTFTVTAAGVVAAASLTLTTPLAVTEGGTAGSTIGTGAFVRATSPTLVTPLLGTPTSGVATNLTGLPLTTGVTGTLPVANGGTNATTVTAHGLQIGNAGATAVAAIAPGATSGHVLTSTGGSSAPTWQASSVTAANAFLIDSTINTMPTAISGLNYLYATDAAPQLILGFNRSAGAIVAGGLLAAVRFDGYDGTVMRNGGFIDFTGDDTGAWASGLAGAKFSVTTTKLGGVLSYRRLIVDNVGDLFIGSTGVSTATTKTNATFVARQAGGIQVGTYATPAFTVDNAGAVAAATLSLSSTLGVTGIATFTAAPVFSSATASTILGVTAGKALTSYTLSGTGTVLPTTAGPTFTGTLAAAAITASATLAVTGVATFTAAPVFSSATASTIMAVNASKALTSYTLSGSGTVLPTTAGPTFTGVLAATGTLAVTGATTLSGASTLGGAVVAADSASGGLVVSTTANPASGGIVEEQTRLFRTTTTTAYVKAVGVIDFTAGSILSISARIIGHRTDTDETGAVYQLDACYQATALNGTTPVLIANATNPTLNIIGESNVATSASLVATGTTVEIRVLGIAATNITWHAVVKTITLDT